MVLFQTRTIFQQDIRVYKEDDVVEGVERMTNTDDTFLNDCMACKYIILVCGFERIYVSASYVQRKRIAHNINCTIVLLYRARRCRLVQMLRLRSHYWRGNVNVLVGVKILNAIFSQLCILLLQLQYTKIPLNSGIFVKNCFQL